MRREDVKKGNAREVMRAEEVVYNYVSLFSEERWIKYTFDTDVQFTEVHVVSDRKLYDDVSGWR